ncbi:MAG TPA: MinD/ParA family protein [Candidatus Atribacteria bacterium]|nr:MinD/ParA family protein [Candidatus Atribacteria bacterium]HPT78029.1 MinD/ParA family protein [Candidatus Atribacteria bacterium]
MDQAERLRALVREKLDKPQEMPGRSISIYTIASGKGGVGKTSVAVNLAIALQQRGKRVLIIDADLGMANVDVMLGLLPRYTLYDVVAHGRLLRDTILTGPYDMKILPGGSGIMELATLDVEQHKSISEQFLTLEGIDTIFIDTAAGISKNLLSFIAFSHELILVTSPEPTAITDAYSVIKVLAQYGLKKNIKVIVNRSVSLELARTTFENLNKTTDTFLHTRLESLGCIPDDPKVVQAVMVQEPFLLQYPGCPASRSINEIADRLIGMPGSRSRIQSIKEVYSRLVKVFS